MNLAERYAAIVKLYHTQGREAWRIARAQMEAEVGSATMERLSEEYELAYEGACEEIEGRREAERYA